MVLESEDLLARTTRRAELTPLHAGCPSLLAHAEGAAVPGWRQADRAAYQWLQRASAHRPGPAGGQGARRVGARSAPNSPRRCPQGASPRRCCQPCPRVRSLKLDNGMRCCWCPGRPAGGAGRRGAGRRRHVWREAGCENGPPGGSHRESSFAGDEATGDCIPGATCVATTSAPRCRGRPGNIGNILAVLAEQLSSTHAPPWGR